MNKIDVLRQRACEWEKWTIEELETNLNWSVKPNWNKVKEVWLLGDGDIRLVMKGNESDRIYQNVHGTYSWSY